MDVPPPPPGNPLYGGSGGPGNPVEGMGLGPDYINPIDWDGWLPPTTGGPDGGNPIDDKPKLGPKKGGTEWDQPDRYEPGKGPEFDPYSPERVEPGSIPDRNMREYGDYSVSATRAQKRMQQYVDQWLSNPSRYDIDVVKQGMDVIQSRMDEVRRRGMQSAEADLARRGLGASTIGQETADLTRAEYDRQEQSNLFNLMREQALTQGQDRSAAFGAALGQAGMIQRQDLFNSEMQFSADRQANADQINQRAQDIQKYGIDQSTALAMAEMEFQNEWRNREMQQRQYEFDTDMGFRREGLDLQRSEFDWRRQEANTQREWMTGEREAGQRWQANQAQLDRAFRGDQAEQDRVIRRRALDLQEQGMNADEAYRKARFDWQQEVDKFWMSHQTGDSPGGGGGGNGYNGNGYNSGRPGPYGFDDPDFLDYPTGTTAHPMDDMSDDQDPYGFGQQGFWG
jgi:hypothetical protein